MKTGKNSLMTFYLLLFIVFNLFMHTINGQPDNSQTQSEFEGAWQGKLKISSIELTVVFNVSKDSAENLIATMDSPDQSAYGINVDEVIVNGDSVKFVVHIINGFFEGIIFADSLMISGTWHQAGMDLELKLYKTDIVEKPNRPQEPNEPFPYRSEEIKFINKETGDTLAGTLTLPDVEGLFTSVILVTGSGPQDRNEELMGHKPFLVLADYFTRNGIAVLRYDDRGIGESTGNFKTATSEDFAKDVLAAVEYLKTRNDIKTIGIAGHSEGGLIAPMVVVQSGDVDFVVLMAGTGIRGDSILILQTGLILRATGEDESAIEKNINISRQIYNILLQDANDGVIKQEVTDKLSDGYSLMTGEEQKEAGEKESFIENQLKVLLSPWFRYFVKYDPYPALKQVKCPLLAINGEKDLQVPPEENLSAIESALKEGGNKNYKIVEMPGLNHLFQNCETGSPMEYGKIEETFSEAAMKIIKDWILENVQN